MALHGDRDASVLTVSYTTLEWFKKKILSYKTEVNEEKWLTSVNATQKRTINDVHKLAMITTVTTNTATKARAMLRNSSSIMIFSNENNEYILLNYFW